MIGAVGGGRLDEHAQGAADEALKVGGAEVGFDGGEGVQAIRLDVLGQLIRHVGGGGAATGAGGSFAGPF